MDSTGFVTVRQFNFKGPMCNIEMDWLEHKRQTKITNFSFANHKHSENVLNNLKGGGHIGPPQGLSRINVGIQYVNLIANN